MPTNKAQQGKEAGHVIGVHALRSFSNRFLPIRLSNIGLDNSYTMPIKEVSGLESGFNYSVA